MPDAPMVAVFDTAFHQTMPPKAYIYASALRVWYTENKVRRYGFHGTSHQYVSQRAADMLGQPHRGACSIATCHLGNGASTCYRRSSARSIDTSMGFTPLGRPAHGHPLPALSTLPSPSTLIDQRGYLRRSASMSALNKESGMLGISGVSSDFRDLEKAAAAEGNERAHAGHRRLLLQGHQAHRLLRRCYGRPGRCRLHRRCRRELHFDLRAKIMERSGVPGPEAGS